MGKRLAISPAPSIIRPTCPIDTECLEALNEVGIIMRTLGLPFNWQAYEQVLAQATPLELTKHNALKDAESRLRVLLLALRIKLLEAIDQAKLFSQVDSETLSKDTIINDIQTVTIEMLRLLVTPNTINSIYEGTRKNLSKIKPVSPYYSGVTH